MDIAELARTRRTCKAYDPTRKIPAAEMEQLLTLLRYAPSSVNSQPWHFFLAASEAARQRVASATKQGTYAANEAKILNASHVVVLCARVAIDDAYLAALLQQEAQDGRFPSPEAREAQARSRSHYVDLHRFDLKDTAHWTEKQVYLALGALLFGAAALGIDATPIEGFDARVLNAELGLRERGLTSVVIVALGYHGADDFNARLAKSRLPAGEVISLL